jgi:hypothetical protein
MNSNAAVVYIVDETLFDDFYCAKYDVQKYCSVYGN